MLDQKSSCADLHFHKPVLDVIDIIAGWIDSSPFYNIAVFVIGKRNAAVTFLEWRYQKNYLVLIPFSLTILIKF